MVHFGILNPPMNKLKEIRENMGMSQVELAELAETSQPQIVKLENGSRKMTKEWAVRLALVLGTHPARLLFTDEELATFRGFGADKGQDRPWESLLAEAAAKAKRQQVAPQAVHARLQAQVPLTTEQMIAMLAMQPRIQQELALQISEEILEHPESH